MHETTEDSRAHKAPRINNLRRSLFVVAGATAVAGAAIVVSSAGATAAPPGGNVTLCHGTSSNTNPYETFTTDEAGAYDGHLDHTGTVWYDGHPKKPAWGDIIPPFEYNGTTYSLNWDAAGQAIWANGCKPVDEPSSTPTSTTTTVTTTPPVTTTVPSSSGTSGVVTSKPPTDTATVTDTAGPIPNGVDAGAHTVGMSAGTIWGVVLLLSAGLIGLATAFWPAGQRRHG